MRFAIASWCTRLAEALSKLHTAQVPYIERYWQATSYPTRITFNGSDETPFHNDDLRELYDLARLARRTDEIQYYRPLRDALDPVRGVLRSHPAVGRAIGSRVGNDEFLVEISNGTTLTWLSALIAGLMERASELPSDGFHRTAYELGALLDASSSIVETHVPSDLDLGYDLMLFFGPRIDRRIELNDGLSILPFAAVKDWVEPSWIRDFVPEHVDRRDLRQIGAVAHPFRWRPSLHQRSAFREGHIRRTPDFEWNVLRFLDLLAVCNQSPIVPFARLDGCVHRTACVLLGTVHNHRGIQPGRTVGKRYDPFRQPERLQHNALELALQIHIRKDSQRERLAPVLSRLAEALARNGPFALNDRILDVSQAIELMFEVRGTGISKKLQRALSELLAEDQEHNESIRSATRHFYSVRSAIVHGASDDWRKERMKERQRAFTTGFHLAREAYLKLVLEGEDDH